MKLVRVYRQSRQIDDLIQKNFGTGESLWRPKCFDRLYKLTDGSQLLAVCSLQRSEQGYWILCDLCTDPAQYGKGYASELVRRVCEHIRGPIWADATHPGSEKILQRHGFTRVDFGPWEVSGQAYYRILSHLK